MKLPNVSIVVALSLFSRGVPVKPMNIAPVLQVSPKTVTRWAKEGKLPSRRTLGGHRRYARADIESLVERLEEQIPA